MVDDRCVSGHCVDENFIIIYYLFICGLFGFFEGVGKGGLS